MKQRFADKDDARQAVWDRLQSERLARFPFPPHGRIPNFVGARAAADVADRILHELGSPQNGHTSRPMHEASLMTNLMRQIREVAAAEQAARVVGI